MEEYINNHNFLESIPGNMYQPKNSNSNTNVILFVVLAIGVGAVVGFTLKQLADKKYILKLKSENEKLKKGSRSSLS